MNILLGLVVLLVLMALALPMGAALGLAGVITLANTVPASSIVAIMTEVVHSNVASSLMLAIPMFVLMSEFLACGGVAEDLLLSCNRMLHRVRGGMAMACILAGAVHAAATGSSTASAASLAKASFPAMMKAGYSPSFAVGTISAAGTLAIMIPPSVAFLLFGLVTETSVGKLFLGGIIPGILTALAYMVTITLTLRLKPQLGPTRTEEFGKKSDKGGQLLPMMMLIVLVLGGLYSGLATPTEISAIGALGALAISLWSRRMTKHGFNDAVGTTLRITGMIVLIIIGAHLFGYYISFSQVTQTMLGWVSNSGLSPTSVMLLIVFTYLVMGMFMDQAAIIILTAPITTSLMVGLGYDPVWWGIIIIKTAEIGMIHPPLGMVTFVTARATKVDLKSSFLGVIPFLIAEMFTLGLLIAFPQLTLYLGG
ncbi:TRAP transporter large permease [Noviherbaspirillum sedimenti]|uniref:TRAP transporter large permease protein n=1 Tax=Noviherbaspirillum sedimenti TaxID=2320865 RepID=A0A3A3G9R5_9BURK|nr:TRAP transporter large permease subunit [Noviherbaspirillum sedimenti]RJG04514.1 TRAP transporter large permease subunit [Noviherbaspirillum sedimenti]